MYPDNCDCLVRSVRDDVNSIIATVTEERACALCLCLSVKQTGQCRRTPSSNCKQQGDAKHFSVNASENCCPLISRILFLALLGFHVGSFSILLCL